eukprot:NODE_18_length_47517_cov_0.674814.p27 type:complete len:119 gc:universal NODE_18_length_47517_cov_0.674814:45328-45684(+)
MNSTAFDANQNTQIHRGPFRIFCCAITTSLVTLNFVKNTQKILGRTCVFAIVDLRFILAFRFMFDSVKCRFNSFGNPLHPLLTLQFIFTIKYMRDFRVIDRMLNLKGIGINGLTITLF